MNIQITWYGHSALGIETGGYHLQVDPYIHDNPAASVTLDKLRADYILVSHGHGDHIGDTMAIAKRTGAQVITVNEIAVWLLN